MWGEKLQIRACVGKAQVYGDSTVGELQRVYWNLLGSTVQLQVLVPQFESVR